MNTIEKAFPSQKRDATIVMGRQDYLSVLWRLIAAELYILRRRSHSL